MLAKKGAHLLRYASNRGDADLRKAIATYLGDFRGAHCHPDQIIIVAGMQQAMLISAMVLLNPGEAAWVEDPGYHMVQRTFIFASAAVVLPRDFSSVISNGCEKSMPSGERSWLLRCSRAVGRFDGKGPQRDGSTFSRD